MLALLLSLPRLPFRTRSCHFVRVGLPTSSFRSEFATQAAAADERFVYAVSNTHVARYDRENKKLLGTGTMADAKHLNSAFVWKEEFIARTRTTRSCRRRRHPRFDPNDDSLKMHHRFVNSPGSPSGALAIQMIDSGGAVCPLQEIECEDVFGEHGRQVRGALRWTFRRRWLTIGTT